MSTPNTIIFDLDGTLIHSAPDIHAAVNVALSELGRAPLDLATVISFIGNGMETLMKRSLKATGGMDQATHKQAYAAALAFYTAHPTTLTHVYPGVIETLKGLQGAGVKMGICTNKPTGPAQDICAQLDLTRFFDVIIGAEDGVPKKPDASPLLATIKTLNGTQADTLYVGDSSVDYRTARNAGVDFRLFSGGYLNHPLPNLAATDRFAEWSMNAVT